MKDKYRENSYYFLPTSTIGSNKQLEKIFSENAKLR